LRDASVPQFARRTSASSKFPGGQAARTKGEGRRPTVPASLGGFRRAESAGAMPFGCRPKGAATPQRSIAAIYVPRDCRNSCRCKQDIGSGQARAQEQLRDPRKARRGPHLFGPSIYALVLGRRRPGTALSRGHLIYWHECVAIAVGEQRYCQFVQNKILPMCATWDPSSTFCVRLTYLIFFVAMAKTIVYSTG